MQEQVAAGIMEPVSPNQKGEVVHYTSPPGSHSMASRNDQDENCLRLFIKDQHPDLLSQ